MNTYTVHRLVAEVARTFYVTPTEVMSPLRRADVVDARHVLLWILRHHHHLTYVSIGQRVARDHTTVIHGVRRVESNPDLIAIARGVIDRAEARKGAA